MPTRSDILAALNPAARKAVERQLAHPEPIPDRTNFGTAPRGGGLASANRVGGVTVYALVRTVSELNARGHWAKRERRKHDQATGVAIAFTPVLPLVRLIPPPYLVTMTRLGGRMLDDDNLAGALKAVQDSVARILDVDDGDRDAVRWVRGQLVGKELRAAKLDVTPPAVRIRVETRKE
jgi:hypothetical protein